MRFQWYITPLHLQVLAFEATFMKVLYEPKGTTTQNTFHIAVDSPCFFIQQFSQVFTWHFLLESWFTQTIRNMFQVDEDEVSLLDLATSMPRPGRRWWSAAILPFRRCIAPNAGFTSEFRCESYCFEDTCLFRCEYRGNLNIRESTICLNHSISPTWNLITCYT